MRAPSPHNVQPWRVRLVDDARAELWIEQARTLPKEDVTGSFLVLTMGIFLEAIRIAAAERGLGLEVTLTGDVDGFSAAALAARPEAHVKFALLTLVPRAATEENVAATTEMAVLLARRRTCRMPLRPDPVPADALATIARTAREHGLGFGHTADHVTIEAALALNGEAVRDDLNAAPYHDELTSWFRVSAAAARKTRDGLDARCMNTTALDLWTARHAPWVLRLPLLGRLLLASYRRRTGPVPALAWLSGPFWDPAAAYRDGPGLLRVWLEITRCDMWILPFGNLVTNRPVAARVEALLGATDVWLVFKLGFASPPPESYRRGVEEVLFA